MTSFGSFNTPEDFEDLRALTEPAAPEPLPTDAMLEAGRQAVYAYTGCDKGAPSICCAMGLADEVWKAMEAARPAATVTERKWLDPECAEDGCQSLVWRSRYEAAVEGRQEFRAALREERKKAG